MILAVCVCVGLPTIILINNDNVDVAFRSARSTEEGRLASAAVGDRRTHRQLADHGPQIPLTHQSKVSLI